MSVARGCGGDAAAYALGALDPGEAQSFRRHLERCTICHDEVAAFEQATHVLASAVPQLRVPHGLRRRVMRAVRRESGRRELAPSARRLVLAGTAAAAAAAAAAGWFVVAPQAGDAPGRGRVVQASVVGVRGTAEVRVGPGHAELIVTHMLPPPSNHIYQVWLERAAGTLVPTAALFTVNAAGQGEVAVPGDLRGVDAVLVTPEPAGGSRAPTRAPVIIARM